MSEQSERKETSSDGPEDASEAKPKKKRKKKCPAAVSLPFGSSLSTQPQAQIAAPNSGGPSGLPGAPVNFMLAELNASRVRAGFEQEKQARIVGSMGFNF